MTVTDKKLASLTWLAGDECDGSFWVVSKTMKYSPACEQAQRCISTYSKSSFKHHWTASVQIQNRNFGVTFWPYCWISLAYKSSHYPALGFLQQIYQHTYFLSEKWKRERKTNFYIDMKCLLRAWKGNDGESRFLQPSLKYFHYLVKFVWQND